MGSDVVLLRRPRPPGRPQEGDGEEAEGPGETEAGDGWGGLAVLQVQDHAGEEEGEMGRPGEPSTASEDDSVLTPNCVGKINIDVLNYSLVY